MEMNEGLLYTLDPYIISILFRSKTDEATLEIYTKMVESIDLVLKNTIKEFLQENGFSEDEIQKVIDSEDPENIDPKIKPYLQNIILVKRIESNSRQFIKLYYDQLLPNLNPEEKTQLETYLKDSEELVNKKKEQVIEGVKALKLILEENGVETYDELRAKFEKEDGTIQEDVENKDGEVAKAEELLPSTDQPVINEQTPVAEVPVVEAPAVPIQDQVLPSSDLSQPPVITDTTLPAIVETSVVTEPVNNELPAIENPTSIETPIASLVEPVGEITVGPVNSEVPADPLLTPTKATIVDDETAVPVIAPVQGGDTVAQTTEAPAPINAVNQLQNMGIDLNDALQQPPQS